MGKSNEQKSQSDGKNCIMGDKRFINNVHFLLLKENMSGEQLKLAESLFRLRMEVNLQKRKAFYACCGKSVPWIAMAVVLICIFCCPDSILSKIVVGGAQPLGICVF